MKIKLWIVILILGLSNVTLAAEDNYKGGIQIVLKEQSGSNFYANTGFETTPEQIIISYFRRTSGQLALVSNGALHIDPSKMNKYHSSLNILGVDGDLFKASITLFSNLIVHDAENSKGVHKSTLIAEHQIEGRLFTNNKYTFIEKGNPDLYVKIEFDKVFTEEEIKERFRQRAYNKGVNGR